MRNFFLFLFLSFFCSLQAFEKLPLPKQMSLSVIVPCHSKHAKFLPKLIEAYAEGTVLPDEIVISLSGADRVSKEVIDKIKNSSWPFPVILLTENLPLAAGANRNRAAKIANGDILASQDADDLPHPQRIEIIKYLFENYKLEHLMHGWLDVNAFIPDYSLEELSWFESPLFTNELGGGTYCNGPIAMLKEVFQSVKWPENLMVGEDVTFNKEVYKKFKHTLVLKTPIYIYRHRLSVNKI